MSSDALGPDEKLCPFCAEVIKKAAIKCRWCGSDLPQAEPEPHVSLEKQPADEPEPPERGSDEPESPELSSAVEVRAQRASRPPLLAVLLAVLVLLAAAGLWVAVHRAADDSVAPDGQLTSEGARRAIMEQAAALTTKAMSYRAASSAADIKAAEKVMTPRMVKKYEKTLPGQDQRGQQAQLGIVVQGTVASMSGASGTCKPEDCAVALLSATRDTAEVLAFVNQDVTVKDGKNSVVSQTWQRVRLVKQHGVWLIDDMQASSG